MRVSRELAGSICDNSLSDDATLPENIGAGNMKLDFVTVDVFTGTQFAGNPLGVVLNAE